MAPKRRAESTPELVTDPKRPHVSIIRINSDVPDELLNTSTGVMTLGADLDLSNISNDYLQYPGCLGSHSEYSTSS